MTVAAGRDSERSDRRDLFIDTVRALSLIVVVVWHWVFSTIVWDASGPHAGNPIGTTRGLWMATWLLQVMPMFFFAGGYVHKLGWESSGGGWSWVIRRLRALWAPALSLVVVGVAIYFAAGQIAPEADWIGTGIVLILSPLWFLIVYAMLVATAPIWFWMHNRYGELAPVLLVGLAVVVDVLRFRYHVFGVEWINMLIVWAIPHQLGFYYDRFCKAPKRFAQALALSGFFALFGLTNMGLYPRSMVGVPGEDFSNMGPPTLAIAALTILQVGVLMLMRERIMEWASKGWGERIVTFAARNSMRIFLWHAPGYAIVYAIWRVLDLPGESPVVDGMWWLWRPLWLVAPIIPTAILASTVGTLTIRPRHRAPTALAT
ncbi:MAG: acyltransferase [Actinomycetota bacterium]